MAQAKAVNFDAKAKEEHLADAKAAGFRKHTKFDLSFNKGALKKIDSRGKGSGSLSWSEAKKIMQQWVAEAPKVNVASYAGTWWAFGGTWYVVTMWKASGKIGLVGTDSPGMGHAVGNKANTGVLMDAKFQFDLDYDSDEWM